MPRMWRLGGRQWAGGPTGVRVARMACPVGLGRDVFRMGLLLATLGVTILTIFMSYTGFVDWG